MEQRSLSLQIGALLAVLLNLRLRDHRTRAAPGKLGEKASRPGRGWPQITAGKHRALIFGKSSSRNSEVRTATRRGGLVQKHPSVPCTLREHACGKAPTFLSGLGSEVRSVRDSSTPPRCAHAQRLPGGVERSLYRGGRGPVHAAEFGARTTFARTDTRFCETKPRSSSIFNQ